MNRFISFSLFLLVFFVLTSCGADGDKYYLMTDKAKGIKSGTEIRYNGVDVGEVDEVKVKGQKIQVTMVVDPSVKIGKTATFSYVGLFFRGKLEINGGKDTDFYKPGSRIYSNINGITLFSALESAIENADSLNRANSMDTLEVLRIGSFASGGKKYAVYTCFSNGVNAASYDGDSHVIFTSSTDTIVYELENRIDLPYKFDGKYFYNDNGRSLFNGFNEDLCLKAGCYEQAHPDLTMFREGL